MWRNRKRRTAISRALIEKKSNLIGCFVAGYNAYRRAKDGDRIRCPYHPKGQTPEHDAWWKGAEQAAEESENG